MTYIGDRDFLIEVQKGNVAGHELILIRGHDQALTTTRTTVTPTITTANINQSAIQSSATTVKVASTDDTNDNSGGTGALTVQVQGLDSSGNEQTETVTMDGTTEVETNATWSAINGLVVVTTGSNNANTGTIWCGTGTFTAGVPAVEHYALDIGNNLGMTAIYTVPTGKALVLIGAIFNVATTNKDVEFFIETSTDGHIQWLTQIEIGMEPSEFASPIVVTEILVAGDAVRVEALSSAASTDVMVIVRGILYSV